MKIRTKGSQEFSVPNDEFGRLILHLMKRFLNKDHYGYRRRGRGPRERFVREDGSSAVTFNGQLGLSPDDKKCEWIAVYLQNRKPKLPSVSPPVSMHQHTTDDDVQDLSDDELTVLDIALDTLFGASLDGVVEISDGLGISLEDANNLVKNLVKKLR